MMRGWLNAVILSGLLCCSPVADARPIVLGTYNVENYLVQDRRVDERWMREHPKPESEKKALRQVIRAVDADILFFQEMGPGDFLEELRQDLAQEGMLYPHAVLGRGEDQVRHLAMLSRIPPVRVLHHDDLDFSYLEDRMPVKRGMLEVVFEDEAGEWSVFCVHLKSRWTEHREDPQAALRREREARAARDRVLERYPDAIGRYVILGDFNDSTRSAPVRRFLQRGAVTISGMVPAFDSHGLSWTYHFEREDRYERVDYILVSPAMQAAVVDGRGSIHDGPGSMVASDHRLVWIALDLSAKMGDSSIR